MGGSKNPKMKSVRSRVKKARRTRIARDLVEYGETILSSPSSSSSSCSSGEKTHFQPPTLSSDSGEDRQVYRSSVSEVAKFLHSKMGYDFKKHLDSEEVFSFENIVSFLAEWLNGNKMVFRKVREFFDEKVGKNGRADGTQAARLFTGAYWDKFSVGQKLVNSKFPDYVDRRKTKKAAAPSAVDTAAVNAYQKRVGYLREYKFPGLILSTFKNKEAIPVLSSLIVATYINCHDIDSNNVPWSTLESVIGSKIVAAARKHGVHKISGSSKDSSSNEEVIRAFKFQGLPPAPTFEGMGEQAYIESVEAASVATTKTSNALIERENAHKNFLQAQAEAERANDYRNRAMDKVEMAKSALKINIDKLSVYKVDQQSRDSLRQVTGCGGKRCDIFSNVVKLVADHLLDDSKDDEFLSAFLDIRKTLIDVNNENPEINFIPSENDYEQADLDNVADTLQSDHDETEVELDSFCIEARDKEEHNGLGSEASSSAFPSCSSSSNHLNHETNKEHSKKLTSSPSSSPTSCSSSSNHLKRKRNKEHSKSSSSSSSRSARHRSSKKAKRQDSHDTKSQNKQSLDTMVESAPIEFDCRPAPLREISIFSPALPPTPRISASSPVLALMMNANDSVGNREEPADIFDFGVSPSTPDHHENFTGSLGVDLNLDELVDSFDFAVPPPPDNHDNLIASLGLDLSESELDD